MVGPAHWKETPPTLTVAPPSAAFAENWNVASPPSSEAKKRKNPRRLMDAATPNRTAIAKCADRNALAPHRRASVSRQLSACPQADYISGQGLSESCTSAVSMINEGCGTQQCGVG